MQQFQGISMRNIDKTDRIVYIDYIKAICMVWIIGFWHLSEYCDLSFAYQYWASNLTTGVLATFIFISGYFLGDKQTSSKQDIIRFYQNRVLRIYPCFLLSCVSLYILNRINAKIYYIAGLKQLVTTLLGVTCFFEPAAYTVWFMSMLILFYAITPLIQSAKKMAYKILIMSLLITVTIVLESTIGIDDRMLYLLPVYFLGLLAAPHKLEISHFRFKTNIILVTLGITIWVVCNSISENIEETVLNLTLLNLAISISSIMILFMLGRVLDRIIEKNGVFGTILQGISYGGLMAYLFHRQMFGVVYLFTGEFATWAALVVILPMVLAISYVLQRIYDRFTRAWIKQNQIKD